MRVDLQPAADQLLRTVRGVPNDQLEGPTPCEGRSVGQLLQHIVRLTAAFRAAAEKDLGPWTDTNPDAEGWPPLEKGWRPALEDRLPALVEAWRDPAAWEGMTRAGLVALDELVLHGWDLARDRSGLRRGRRRHGGRPWLRRRVRPVGNARALRPGRRGRSRRAAVRRGPCPGWAIRSGLRSRTASSRAGLPVQQKPPLGVQELNKSAARRLLAVQNPPLAEGQNSASCSRDSRVCLRSRPPA